MTSTASSQRLSSAHRAPVHHPPDRLRPRGRLRRHVPRRHQGHCAGRRGRMPRTRCSSAAAGAGSSTWHRAGDRGTRCAPGPGGLPPGTARVVHGGVDVGVREQLEQLQHDLLRAAGVCQPLVRDGDPAEALRQGVKASREPVKRAPIVRRRTLRSSQRGQFSRWWLFPPTRSRIEVLPRTPLTCAQPVSPDLTRWRSS